MAIIKTLRSQDTISAMQWQPGLTFPGMIEEVPPMKIANFGEFPAHALLFDGTNYINVLPGEWVVFTTTGHPCAVWSTVGNYEDVTPVPGAAPATMVPDENSFIGWSPEKPY